MQCVWENCPAARWGGAVRSIRRHDLVHGPPANMGRHGSGAPRVVVVGIGSYGNCCLERLTGWQQPCMIGRYRVADPNRVFSWLLGL